MSVGIPIDVNHNLRKCWCSKESNAPHSHCGLAKTDISCCSTHVDRHTSAARQSDGRHLRDVLRGLHVRSIAAGTEDDGDLGVGVDVVGRDEGTGRVVDEGGKLTRDVLMSDLQRCKRVIHLRVA